MDLKNEELITLAEAAKYVQEVAGHRPGITTLWRHCTKGCRGVHLEHLRFGKVIRTSRPAVLRFMENVAEAYRDPENAPRRQKKAEPTTQRNRRQQAARDSLRSAGVMD